MGITNRDKDVSEQKQEWIAHKDLVNVTGGTYILAIAPYACEVRAVSASAKALSGAPTIELERHTFVAGSGVTVTSTSLMVALTIPAFGTSGQFESASLAAAGSSFVQLARGDALVASIIGANTGADHLCVTVVVKKLQDIVSQFGSAT